MGAPLPRHPEPRPSSGVGARLRSDGIRSPFEAIGPTHTYADLDDAKTAVKMAGKAIETDGLPAGLAPLVIGVAGYGNVARGVQEILAELPTREVPPDALDGLAGREVSHLIVQTTFKEEHLVGPRDGGQAFELQDYYDHADRYRSVFNTYLPNLTVLMNCNYWDERYPRLVTKAEIRALFNADRPPRLKVIGDLGCDIEGAVECTLKCTEPGDPVYVYDPVEGTITPGVDGRGPVILAVDILPSELPREASDEFSRALATFLPSIASADYEVPFERLELPSPIRRAVILHKGEFTPKFTYLEAHIEAHPSG